MKSRISLLLFLILFATAPLLRATVTIEFSIGPIDVPAGTVGILVADTNDNGFTSPADATGTVLTAGLNLAGSDDVIVSTIQADDGAHWGGQAGFSETLAAIDYNALGIDAGTALNFYWFPGHQALDGMLANGDEWHAFRETDAANGGGTIDFVAPADWGAYRLSQLAPGLGGDFDPSDPANSGEYDEGLVGAEPPAPENISATDGTHPDKVVVTWNAVAHATDYHVYRYTADSYGDATKVGEATSTSWEDTFAAYDTTYYYWILPVNGAVMGTESASDSGFRQLGAAGTLTASDGTSTAGVDLNWAAVADAGSYDIYRGPTADFAGANLIGNTTSATASDPSASAGTIFFYWIVARSDDGDAPQSTPDTGWKALAPVGNLTAEHLAGKVRLSWAAAPEALNYRILRSETGDLNDAVLLDTITGTTFEDASAEFGTEYTYWVESANDQTASETQSTTGAPANVRPDLTIGEKSTQFKGNNLYNTSGSGQKLTEITTNAKRIKVYAELQNDHAAPDSLRLVTGRGNNYFTVKVIRLNNGFANITAAAKAGIYTSSPLAEGERDLLKIEIKPKRSKVKDKNKRYTLSSRASSTAAQILSDTVKLQTVHKR